MLFKGKKYKVRRVGTTPGGAGIFVPLHLNENKEFLMPCGHKWGEHPAPVNLQACDGPEYPVFGMPSQNGFSVRLPEELMTEEIKRLIWGEWYEEMEGHQKG